MPLDPLTWCLVTVIVACGSWLQGSVGFGWALVVAPLLMWIEPGFVPVPMLMAALSLTLAMALRERRAIDVRGVGWALLGRLPGALLGAVAVARLSRPAMDLTFAITVGLAVLISWRGRPVEPTRGWLLTAGAASGLMGTTSSIGGPPIALVYQGEQGARLRGTLSGFFVGGGLISLASLAAFGQVGAAQMQLALMLLPGISLGFLLSNRTRHLLDAGRTRAAVLTLAALSAASLLVRYLAS